MSETRADPRWLRALTTLACAVLVAGCGTTDEGADVKTVAVEQAAREARTGAETVEALAGVDARPATGGGEFMVARCTGRQGESSEDVYFVRGSYHLTVGVDRADAWVESLGEQWAAAGWRSEVQTTQGGRPHLTAVDPATEVEYVLGPTDDAATVLLWVSSPCYASPDGVPPFGAYDFPGTPGPSSS